MDVELQILKHLARDAHPTVAIIDKYCAEYKLDFIHLGDVAQGIGQAFKQSTKNF